MNLILSATRNSAEGSQLFFQILSALAFLIACASLGWQIWSYRDAKKPKLGAKACLEDHVSLDCPVLRVDIWNPGQVPVYIKTVALGYEDPPPVGIPGKITVTEVGRLIMLHPLHGFRSPLEPGQGCTFRLPDTVVEACRSLAAMAPDRLFVGIRSPVKELLRLSGQTIHLIVAGMVGMAVEGPQAKQGDDTQDTADRADQDPG